MKNLLKKNWLYIAGAIIGGIAGYLYWALIGCNTGTCAITSSPVKSSIWGTIMGILILSIFKNQNSNEKSNTN